MCEVWVVLEAGRSNEGTAAPSHLGLRLLASETLKGLWEPGLGSYLLGRASVLDMPYL
jgi:hypothetical protein